MWAASCLATCCAACACEACKGIASSISRRSARIAYCGLFTISLLLAWLLRDFAQPILEKFPWIGLYDGTKEFYGTQAVLRVSLGTSMFYGLFALALMGVNDQRDQRDSWHHGFWMLKFIMWIGAVVLAFLAPLGAVTAYGQVARLGAALFLMVQMVVLLDFAYRWNESWVEKDEQAWYIALLVVSLCAYLGGFILIGFLWHWFAPSELDCQWNLFLITVTFILILVCTLASLHPAVNGSLLPSSIISCYCCYLLYNAFSSEPRNYPCNGLARHLDSVSNGNLAVGMVTTLLAVVYSALRAGSSTALSSPGSPKKSLLGGSSEDDDDDVENESAGPQPVKYVYSGFHLIFCFASMYSAMLLTGWGKSGVEGKDIIDVGWPSVTAKIMVQWATAGLYVWTLVAPLIFPDRDFS